MSISIENPAPLPAVEDHFAGEPVPPPRRSTRPQRLIVLAVLTLIAGWLRFTATRRAQWRRARN